MTWRDHKKRTNLPLIDIIRIPRLIPLVCGRHFGRWGCAGLLAGGTGLFFDGPELAANFFLIRAETYHIWNLARRATKAELRLVNMRRRRTSARLNGSGAYADEPQRCSFSNWVVWLVNPWVYRRVPFHNL